jgi:hypothetical protein
MKKRTGQSYIIKSVSDLYQLPEHCLDDCLLDLAACIRSHKAIRKLAHGKLKPLDHIEFIDDGKHNITAQLIE